MIVQINAGQRRDEDTEFDLIVYPVGKHRIKSVDTFYEQNAPLAKTQFSSVIFPLARSEIILGHFHFFAFEKPYQVFLQGFMVDGVKIVEIVLAVRKARGVHPVYEIIIGGKRYRLHSAGTKLDAESLAHRGFT